MKYNELTWKDINTIEKLINCVLYEYRNGLGDESFGKEVLKRFLEIKNDGSSEIPSNHDGLDEAAEKYYRDWDTDVNPTASLETAFKAGAEWRDKQIPNTPEGLDEAAEKADNNGIVGFECGFSITKKHPRDYFKDGVEWVCGQGVTFDAEMKWYDGLLLFSEDERQFLTSSCFNEGDKVVVQVRKK